MPIQEGQTPVSGEIAPQRQIDELRRELLFAKNRLRQEQLEAESLRQALGQERTERISLRALVYKLLEGMTAWAADEDGVYDGAAEAYDEACRLFGFRTTAEVEAAEASSGGGAQDTSEGGPDTPDGSGASGEPPDSVAYALHLAQLAAREHVVPQVVLAAERALRDGDERDSSHFMFIAAAIDGRFDREIVAFARSFIRFVEGLGEREASEPPELSAMCRCGHCRADHAPGGATCRAIDYGRCCSCHGFTREGEAAT